MAVAALFVSSETNILIRIGICVALFILPPLIKFVWDVFRQNNDLRDKVKQLETEKSNIAKERDEAKAAIEAWSNKYREEKEKNTCLIQSWTRIQTVVAFAGLEKSNGKDSIQIIQKFIQESNADYSKLK